MTQGTKDGIRPFTLCVSASWRLCVCAALGDLRGFVEVRPCENGDRLGVIEFLFAAPVAALLDESAGAFEFLFVAEEAGAVKVDVGHYCLGLTVHRASGDMTQYYA